jgi:hypothetical protein
MKFPAGACYRTFQMTVEVERPRRVHFRTAARSLGTIIPRRNTKKQKAKRIASLEKHHCYIKRETSGSKESNANLSLGTGRTETREQRNHSNRRPSPCSQLSISSISSHVNNWEIWMACLNTHWVWTGEFWKRVSCRKDLRAPSL